MDLKLKDHIVVNKAMGKKSNMDGDQLTDFDKTELRTKSQIGCPNILFKHVRTRFDAVLWPNSEGIQLVVRTYI